MNKEPCVSLKKKEYITHYLAWLVSKDPLRMTGENLGRIYEIDFLIQKHV
jgi:hypothetical protein